MEFKAFEKIPALHKIEMAITQKLHGSNAVVAIEEVLDINSATDPTELLEIDTKIFRLQCGSRTRWIKPTDDNYGFATFVNQHREEFIRKLGAGVHFGEWIGLGINSGEGLDHKVFVLFDFWKYPPERPLPPNTVVVPVLYRGSLNTSKIDECMSDLKTNGSKLSPGFNRPEGIVITILGQRIKKVFEAEDSKWRRGDEKYKAAKEAKTNTNITDYLYLLQPIRMEKLLSKDERYLREYPKSLPEVCKAYMEDLVAEGELSLNEDTLKLAREALGGELFKFAKECIANQLKTL
jgi:hypothetical protein